MSTALELMVDCIACVAARVAAHGLPPVLWGPDAQNIDLDEDLCKLPWGEMNLGSIMARISALIDKDADDVRAYRIPANPWKVTLGSAILPEGILLGDGFAV